MRRRFLPVTILAAAAATAPAPGVGVSVVGKSPSALPLDEPAAAGLPTRLTFHDEFDGARIDAGKWPRIGCFRFCNVPHDTTLVQSTGEQQRFDAAGVIPDRGGGFVRLRIEPDSPEERARWLAAVARGPGQTAGSAAQLASLRDHAGSIHTYPNYPFTAGSLLEARIRLPLGCKGRWPALWSFAYPNPVRPGQPFQGQEIDMLEANGQGSLKITVHNDVSPAPSVEVRHPTGWFVERVWRDHDGKRIYAWIDGKLVAVLPAGNANDVAMPVMASIAGGTSKWAFIGLPDATTSRSCEMQVDYIRIYAR